jgi:NADH-quinone oxidoreductase subunit M
MLGNFDFHPTVDAPLQYEIAYPWSSYIKSSFNFGIDGMSMLMVILTNILVPLIILSSFNEKKAYPNSFYALILLMQFGLLGVFTSLDGLLFYIFWEVTLIPIWFIAGLWGRKTRNQIHYKILCIYIRRIIIHADWLNLCLQSISIFCTDGSL